MAPIRPMLRDAGVTEQQWRVLRVLDYGGPIDPTGLAEAALLFPPSVARILKELVDRGWIVREAHARDKRRAIVTLGPQGEALIRQTERGTLKCYASYRRRFGKARIDALIAELREFIVAIEPVTEEFQDLVLTKVRGGVAADQASNGVMAV